MADPAPPVPPLTGPLAKLVPAALTGLAGAVAAEVVRLMEARWFHGRDDGSLTVTVRFFPPGAPWVRHIAGEIGTTPTELVRQLALIAIARKLYLDLPEVQMGQGVPEGPAAPPRTGAA